MAHLPVRPHRLLAVKMDAGAGHVQPLAVLGDLVADEIDHLGASVAERRCQWPTRDRPDMLLELRYRAPVERPVARVVYARRDLVHHYGMSGAIANDEHLDRKHAHIAECFGNPAGDPKRLSGHRRSHFGGYSRYFQDMAAMLVLGDIEALDFPIAAARRHHGDFAFERHERLDDRGLAADRSPRSGRIVAGMQRCLALAVIPKAPGLEN